jgi:diguanylate cyclase (GGDEF)-like protein
VLVGHNVGIRKRDMRTRFELEDARAELERLSNLDPMTGAWNRRFLERHFDSIASNAQRAGKTLTLVLLDIDCFKSINDNYGHHHGDEILKALTRIFQNHLPGDDSLVRLGGDEFAVLSAHADIESTVKRCLLHLQTDPKLLREGGGIPVGVSCGFASASADTKPDLERLYKTADKSLYKAKKNLTSVMQYSEQVPA